MKTRYNQGITYIIALLIGITIFFAVIARELMVLFQGPSVVARSVKQAAVMEPGLEYKTIGKL